MDALGVDIVCLFPTPMLLLGLHPNVEIEIALAQAYNRWLTQNVLSSEPRIKSMLYLPFNDPEATYKTVQEFGDKKGVIGFHGDRGALQAGLPQCLYEDLRAAGGTGQADLLPCGLQLV